MSAEVQFKRYRAYGIRTTSDEPEASSASKKATPDEMIAWAKEQVGLTEAELVTKYPALLFRPSSVRILLKMQKSLPALSCDRKRNFWLSSMPGYVKNSFMREMIKENGWRVFKWPMTEGSKWADGYDGEEVIWIDEIDPTNAPPGNLLKTLADVEECSYQVKGSTSKIRAKMVIITSNYSLRQCYNSSQDVRALDSRFFSPTFPHWSMKEEQKKLQKTIEDQYAKIY